MSKRLQAVLDEEELAEIRAVAERQAVIRRHQVQRLLSFDTRFYVLDDLARIG